VYAHSRRSTRLCVLAVGIAAMSIFASGAAAKSHAAKAIKPAKVAKPSKPAKAPSGAMAANGMGATGTTSTTKPVTATSGTQYMISTSATIAPSKSGVLVADCAAGDSATGGGFENTAEGNILAHQSHQLYSKPVLNAKGQPTGWTGRLDNDYNKSVTYTVIAVCRAA